MVVFLSFGFWDFLIPTFSVVGNSTFSYLPDVQFSQGAVSEIGSVRLPINGHCLECFLASSLSSQASTAPFRVDPRIPQFRVPHAQPHPAV